MFPSNHRLGLGLVAGALSLLASGPARSSEAVYRKVAPSTALVFKSEGPFGGGSGTGFLVDAEQRLLITARHVVENTTGGIAPAVIVMFAQTRNGEVITDADYYRRNRQTLALRGKVVYESVRRDMAVIQVEKLPDGVKPLPLAAEPARPGQMVHVIGNSSERFGGVFSYCRGYVRNVFRYEELGARVVATQAPTNRGDSGGPTVNNFGEVVGFAAMSTLGVAPPKDSPFYNLQVTGLSVCVSEIREGLRELRDQFAGRQRPAGPDAPPTFVFKGEARAGAHVVTMEKDATYRIVVKAKDFVPDVRIDGFLIGPAPNPSLAPGSDWQQLFIPRETKEYRIQVSCYPGRLVGKGPLPYTLTVDQVSFMPETALEKRQLQVNEHVHKLEAGKGYRIMVRAKDFEPDVQILDGTRTVTTQFNGGKRVRAEGAQALLEAFGLGAGEFETVVTFVPPRTAEYRIVVEVSPYSPPARAPLAYRVQVVEHKVHFAASGQLTAQDPLYPRAGPFKAHAVKLEGGKAYQIDLRTSAFDSQLFLEGEAGKVVTQGFDADGYSARLFFLPARTDTYRIVVTARRVDATGPYLLTVMETPSPQPRLPGVDKKSKKGGE
jgi:hypothetical protein